MPRVIAKIAIDIRTIAPDGVKLKTYDASMPVTTENTENDIEISEVCLKPRLYIIAETFGITNNADISKTPTS